MSLYLDIDLDYFIWPVLRESVANHRPPTTEWKATDPASLLDLLKAKKIELGPHRYLFTNHMQSHLRWWISRQPDNVVIHIDAHSDLYGHSQRDLKNLAMLGCQNYLWHAIREGLLGEIYWVIPDGLLDTSDTNLVANMFTPEQVADVSTQAGILHIELICQTPAGEKIIPYHILSAQQLPIFNQRAQIITVATSPEFIPREADYLVSSMGKELQIDQSVLAKVLQQHQEMSNAKIV